MNGITAVVIVRNEEKNIADCLELLAWADEIIVIDQSSTDRTVEIAKGFTKNVHVTEPKNICNPDRDYGIGLARTEWILLVEADERITPELRAELIGAVSGAGAADIYFMPVKTFFDGKWIKTCGWYPSFIPRLFRKGSIKFGSEIHTNGEFLSDRKAYLKNDLMHYSYNSIDDWLLKFGRYTTQIAADDYRSGKRPGPVNALRDLALRPLYFFILKYVFKQGYRDGWRGLFISLSSALTVAMAYFKLIEVHENEKNTVHH